MSILKLIWISSTSSTLIFKVYLSPKLLMLLSCLRAPFDVACSVSCCVSCGRSLAKPWADAELFMLLLLLLVHLPVYIRFPKFRSLEESAMKIMIRYDYIDRLWPFYAVVPCFRFAFLAWLDRIGLIEVSSSLKCKSKALIHQVDEIWHISKVIVPWKTLQDCWNKWTYTANLEWLISPEKKDKELWQITSLKCLKMWHSCRDITNQGQCLTTLRMRWAFSPALCTVRSLNIQ